MLVVSIQLTSSTWLGFQYLQNSSKDLAQSIIYSPWGGAKGPWLCLIAKLLFCLAWLFSFCFCIFLLLWVNLCYGTWRRPRRLKFFYKEIGGGLRGGSVPGRPHWVLLTYSPWSEGRESVGQLGDNGGLTAKRLCLLGLEWDAVVVLLEFHEKLTWYAPGSKVCLPLRL